MHFRVDMQQVQEQAGWVSGCDSLMVHHIHNAFKENLQKMAPMEEWAEWLESIVDQVITIAETMRTFCKVTSADPSQVP